jgi:hypothetical protein
LFLKTGSSLEKRIVGPFRCGQSAEELRQTVDYAAEHRPNDAPFDVANFGATHNADETSVVGDFAEADAT